jgi:hypothetical protein
MPNPLAKRRVEAAKSIVMLHLAILSAEVVNGCIKEGPIEAIEKEYRYVPDHRAPLRLASRSMNGSRPYRKPARGSVSPRRETSLARVARRVKNARSLQSGKCTQ